MRLQFLRTLSHRIENPQVQYFLKLFLLPIYIIFLHLNGRIGLFYILPVLLFLLFRIEHSVLGIIILLCSVFDRTEMWRVSFEYGNYNLANLINNFGDAEKAATIHYSAITISILVTYFLIILIAKITENKKFSILYFIILIVAISHACFQIFKFNPENISYFHGILLLTLIFINKKIWIIAIAVQHKKYLKFSFFEFLQNINFYTPYARENFSTLHYKSDDFKIYLKGILLCLIFISYVLIKNLIPSTENFLQNKICFGQISIQDFLSTNPALGFSWFCFLRLTIFYSVLEHLVLDTFLLLVPAYLMGYNYNFVIRNIFKATSYADFFGRLMYYYSFVIRTFFIWEIKKILGSFELTRAQAKFCAVFFGVFIGSIVYHWSRDLNYDLVYGKDIFANFFTNGIFYFILLALLITYDLKFTKSVKVNFLIWILITLLLRIVNMYYNTENTYWKFLMMLRLVGINT